MSVLHSALGLEKTAILQWYRKILSDEVKQLCAFPLLAGCVWHQYFQWHQDLNLGYNLRTVIYD